TALSPTLPFESALFIMTSILDGLTFAHDLKDDQGRPLGFVHRDLSPRNVFVRYDGEVRVADFGTAWCATTDPPPAEIVGTPGYLSPEQARLETLDCRSDIFAAGCIFQELVTG